MVVTMVEARIDEGRRDEVVAAYRELLAEGLPPYLAETFLLSDEGSDMWRIVTVWRDRTQLEALRASGETPPAQAVFLAAGGQPTVAVFEVVEQAAG